MIEPETHTGLTTDLAFARSVKSMQEQLESRERKRHLSESGRWGVTIMDDLAQLLRSRRSTFLGTASPDGRSYIQHREA